MMRTQIQLTKNQHQWLKRWAAERGISMSEAVRRCVSARLEAEEAGTDRDGRIRRALAVIGKYSDPEGRSTIARDHDDYLAEAYSR